ncbi:MAG: hypothetical protein H7839_16640 [Magnetococcus sp. YQC-5]
MLSWQNFAITAFSLVLIITLACQRGYTFLEMFSRSTDQAVIVVLRKWFSRQSGSA